MNIRELAAHIVAKAAPSIAAVYTVLLAYGVKQLAGATVTRSQDEGEWWDEVSEKADGGPFYCCSCGDCPPSGGGKDLHEKVSPRYNIRGLSGLSR